jgi:hypothetical protein
MKCVNDPQFIVMMTPKFVISELLFHRCITASLYYVLPREADENENAHKPECAYPAHVSFYTQSLDLCLSDSCGHDCINRGIIFRYKHYYMKQFMSVLRLT